jgi:cytochrome b561
MRNKPEMKQVTRFHPLLVTLHWLMAVLIIGALAGGFFLLAATPNTAPVKIDILRLHMAGGMLILFLMIVRLVARISTSKPADLVTGNSTADRIAPVTHYGFYVLIFLMAGTGYATALLAGLPEIVFAHSGAPLPASFGIFPTRMAHAWLAVLLAGLVVLHVLAALYHHFIRKDGLFKRMAFGSRS